MIRGVSTVYFGGGTPSVLPVPLLKEILCSLKNTFPFAGDGDTVALEITIEVNPDDITPEYAAGLAEAGFNRISMGVQSFIDGHLLWMNRRHSAADAVRAYGMLRDAGFENISLDLIFGYHALGMDQWEYNLFEITGLSPQHISAYQMSVEPGSRISSLLRKGEYILPDDPVCAAQYRMLQNILSGNGYVQYEVSSFSREGFRSWHNTSYWDGTPYIGLGPSAHSFDGSAKRYWNTESIKKYCDYYLSDNTDFKIEAIPPFAGGFEILSEKDVFNEVLMLGLRTREGVNMQVFNEYIPDPVVPVIKRLVKSGDLVWEEGCLRIPADRLFISDSIIRKLFRI